MLLKHSGSYLLARVVPALVSFAALVVYTRILSPEDYGVYVLVIAAVSLVKSVAFSWLDMALLRIMPAHLCEPRALLATVLGLYLLTATVTGVGGIATALLWPDPVVSRLILFAIPLLWAHAWFELNLTLSQAKLRPGRYGLMLCARSIVMLGLGSALVLGGAGAFGPLLGFCAGSALGGLIIACWDWRRIRPRIDPSLARALARYGIPLTGALALGFFLDAADRFMITAFLGEGAVGPYAAAYDLTGQSLTVLMMVVNLAAYPLVLRAFEEGGIAAADRQIRQNGSLLLAVALPATVGIVTLADSIAGVLLGAEFRQTGAAILPWIAAGMLVAGLGSYFFNLAFQLKCRTGLLAWSPAAAAVSNVALNLWLIPAYGVAGAAWATLASYLIALVVCIAIGRRLMRINLDWSQVLRIAVASTVMGVALQIAPDQDGAWGLVIEIALGGLVYGSCALLGNVMGARTSLLNRIGVLSAKPTA